MKDYTMTEIFVKQELNSLQDPCLDLGLTKFSEFDTCCTYDSNMCDDINSSTSLVSFSLTSTNPLPNIDPLLGTDPFPLKEIAPTLDTLTGFENDDLFEYFDFS